MTYKKALMRISTLALFSILFSNIGFSQVHTSEKEKNAILQSQDTNITGKKSQDYSLLLKGIIKNGDKIIPDASIQILLDSLPFLTEKSDDKGKCKIELAINKKYTMIIGKDGYVTKIITINTWVPKANERNYLFPFEVDIFEKLKDLDIAILSKPIAKINFNNFTRQFDYDYNYTARINASIKRLYQDYYLLEKSDNDSINRDKKPSPKQATPKGTPPKKKN